MATTTVSPRPAYRRLLPPSTRMTRARRAPELSAMRRMLSCWTMLLRPLHDLSHPPRHRLGQRPRLHDPDGIARLRVHFVPRLHLLGAGHLLAVDRMGVPADQGHGHRLVHLVAGDHALADLAAGAGGALRLFGHVSSCQSRVTSLESHQLEAFESPRDSWLATRDFSSKIVLILAMSRRIARKRIGFSIDSVAERKRSRNRSSVSSPRRVCRSSPDISRSSFGFTSDLLTLHEAGPHRQLGRGQRQRLLGQVLADALDFEEHPARLDHRDPSLRIALALAHAGLGRLLGDRLVRKDPDPDLAASLHLAGHGHPRCLNLPISDPARLQTHQPELAERHGVAPCGNALGPALELLAELDSLRRQHPLRPRAVRAAGHVL